ncbi:MAG: RDD family protein [Saprospiraceae bacterium]|nr:RDD family protein [Saprospiraceae bacterium]
MNHLIVRRLGAVALDTILIGCYAGLLHLTAFLIRQLSVDPASTESTIKGQVMWFLAITLVVFLYFYLTERSAWRGSFGKKIFSVQVLGPEQQTASVQSVLCRNLFKLVPIEMAHVGMQWREHFAALALAPPDWVQWLFWLPAGLMLVYLVSMLATAGTGSLYDRLCGTRISHRAPQWFSAN